MTGVPILSIVMWAPFVAALVIMAWARHRPLLVRWTAVIGASVPLVLAIWLCFGYDRASAGFQFRESWPLVPSFGIAYNLGIDGMGLVLVLLTAIILFAGCLRRGRSRRAARSSAAVAPPGDRRVRRVRVARPVRLLPLLRDRRPAVYLLIGIWGSSGDVRPQGIFGWAFKRTGVGTKEYAR
jgi:hypothetical protein